MATHLLLLLLLSLTSTSLSQNLTCNSILITYRYISGKKIPPTETNLAKQAYRFESSITITNNGLKELKSWQVAVEFQHREYLSTVSGAVPADGTTTLPGDVGNITFAGYPNADLKTAVETAGDETQYSTRIDLTGSEFGVDPKNAPMPATISLANDGYRCPKPSRQGNNTMQVCCTEDPNYKANITTDKFLPRQNGDLSIMYDVTASYDDNYWAQVSISNNNPLGRLDYWKLSWLWKNDEFIFKMKGAYPSIVDASDCINGPQAQQYKALDFSTVLNCQRRPTLIDLPLDRTNDTTLGMVPNCCRNGTILPKEMDPSKSVSAFQINVNKMPPFLNRSLLSPPQNWKINGTLNPDYVCGAPVRVSPSQYPDSSGLPVNKTVIASWQVVCNITKIKSSSPKCCVSFSAYYNESVVPCNTCACGCPSSSSKSCSTTSPALLLPSQALLVPFDNRTALTTAWAGLKHLPTPNPLPCGDNCGVSINWHLYTDYKRGWTARVTVFNWDGTPFPDWFVAAEMKNATPGFEKAYSFNGTTFNTGVGDKNNTIFLQGLPGLNYIVAESDGKDPKKDPRVPGKQQSVLSFTKKNLPNLNVVGGDGFPDKVFFNGEECSLPSVFPTNSAPQQKGISVVWGAALLFLLMWQWG